jgi:hypothetical protein
LDFWHVVTPYFSKIGKRAEWRVRKNGGKSTPIALIVRVDASEAPDSQRATSYLIVVKITDQAVCVIENLSPAAGVNEHARQAADSGTGKACMKP